MSPGALAGLRVLDLSQVLAGPFCTQMLADHGAEVIKIEPPEGDPARRFAPFRADDTERAFGGYFQSINRGKKSVVLDLKTDAGRAAFLKLVASADVLVENYRAGVMERLGLGFEALAKINPRLVYGAIRGFGDPRSGESPYNDWPAFDVVAQAMGGIMGITGPTADQPLKIGPGVGDTVPALMLAFGILAAVRHAERSGQGQFLDISMIDGVLALCERLVHQYSYAGEVAGPEGNGHPLLCPFGLFRAADGWVAIGCPTDKFWVELAAAIDRPELATDSGWATNAARLARRGEVTTVIEGFTGQRSKADLKALFGGRVPFGPVQNAAEIFADPHFAARDMLVQVEQPGSATPVTIAGVPVHLSATPGAVRGRAPKLGEHTAEVLAGLGADRHS
ncbi:CoA transferase [Immundisolibacter sp.]|uniref:CaiB/BaiF CoA transferase family protein n=1 Tax=Immundisolibacter sp. TaxID=1934948 RepID=UPI002B1BB254|nr:CoA transferase [Immundisolibacter sp.]MEA3220432.1 Acetyl-CoA:oxalate CoA-transferase [Immundisolibacter sp.]